MTTRMNRDQSGQALVEVSFGLIMLCVFVLGIIDCGRAVYDVEVMKNLVGEGSSMASRSAGTDLSTIVGSITTDAGNDLNIGTSGCIIVTSVQNMGSGSIQVTNQAWGGGISGTASCKSKIGCVSGTSGCSNSNATLPAAAVSALTTEGTGSSIAVTEIYYNYSTITPLPRFLGSNALPSQFYAVAYY
jgi:Flp pilus assembly protein TadG